MSSKCFNIRIFPTKIIATNVIVADVSNAIHHWQAVCNRFQELLPCQRQRAMTKITPNFYYLRRSLLSFTPPPITEAGMWGFDLPGSALTLSWLPGSTPICARELPGRFLDELPAGSEIVRHPSHRPATIFLRQLGSLTAIGTAPHHPCTPAPFAPPRLE